MSDDEMTDEQFYKLGENIDKQALEKDIDGLKYHPLFIDDQE